MIQGIYITMPELDRLAGLPHSARVLYLALRTLVNFNTGTVGVRPLISWQGLSEHLYVEPHPGMKAGTFSQQQARRAAGWLVKAGLVEMRSNGKQWHLIFFLPMAQRGFFAGKKADSKPTDQADRVPQRENDDEADNGAWPQADKHQGSVSNYHHRNLYRDSPNEKPVDKLIHPPSLTAAEKSEITQLLHHYHAEDHAQAILDELAFTIEKGALRKGAAGFVMGCIRRAKAGAFNPKHGKAIAARRTQQATSERTEPARPVEPPRASRATARAAMGYIGQFLKGAGHG